MVVAPTAFDYPTKVENITDEMIEKTGNYLLTEDFQN
jgi:hypothetical protein